MSQPISNAPPVVTAMLFRDLSSRTASEANPQACSRSGPLGAPAFCILPACVSLFTHTQLAHYGMYPTDEVNSSIASLSWLLPGALWPRLRPLPLCSGCCPQPQYGFSTKRDCVLTQSSHLTPTPAQPWSHAAPRILLNLRDLI